MRCLPLCPVHRAAGHGAQVDRRQGPHQYLIISRRNQPFPNISDGGPELAFSAVLK